MGELKIEAIGAYAEVRGVEGDVTVLRDGDAILLRLMGRVPPAVIESIRSVWDERLPNIPCVIVDDDVQATVLRRSELV